MEVNIIDFGESRELKNDDASQSYREEKNTLTNSEYNPPEAISGMYGIKTDIYQLGTVIALLLGYQGGYQEAVYYEKDLLKLNQLGFSAEVNKTVVDFLNAMRHPDSHQRPDSDRTLKFINLLEQYFICNSHLQTSSDILKSKLQKNKEFIQSQLSDLATGSWTQTYDPTQYGFGDEADKIVAKFQDRIKQGVLQKNPVSEKEQEKFFKLLNEVTPGVTPSKTLLKKLTSIADGSSHSSALGRFFKPNTQESKKTQKPQTSNELSQQLAKSIQSEANLIEKELKQNFKFFYITVSSRALERLDSHLKNLSSSEIYSTLTEACMRLVTYSNERIVCVKCPKNKIPTHAQIQKVNILWASGKSNDFTDFRTDQSQTSMPRLH